MFLHTSNHGTDFTNGRIVREISQNKNWCIFEGLLFIAIGFLAVVFSGVTALAVEIALSVALFFGGIVRLARGFSIKYNRFWHIFSGLVLLVAGGIILSQPLVSMAILILLLGIFLLAEGIMEIFFSLSYRPFKHWVWILISGTLSLLLGILIIGGGISFGILFVGMAVGLSFAFSGLSMLMLALGIDEKSDDYAKTDHVSHDGIYRNGRKRSM